MWGQIGALFGRLFAPVKHRLSMALQHFFRVQRAQLPHATASSAPEVQACDVFVSHRGPDVKKKLVSHVVSRLQRVSLSVFVDYEIEKGCMSWPTILAHLRGAKCVLLLLTPGFEESPWCLEEVRVMAERSEAVLPVFMDREPGDVNEGSLRRASIKFRPDQPDAQANIAQQWRSAFKSLSGVAGWVHKSEVKCVLLHYYYLPALVSRFCTWSCL